MAISVLNTTFHKVSTSGNVNTVSIPATSVGSTLIVLISFKSGAGNSISGISDDRGFDDGTNFYYHAATGATGSGSSGTVIYNAIWYTVGVPAGLTTVNVYHSNSSITSYVTVIEATGVNTTSPLETSNIKTTTATTTNPVGNATSTAFTNALFVGTGVTTLNSGGQWTTVNNSWTKVNTDTNIDHAQAYKIGSSSQTLSINSVNASQTYLASTAVFNPTANNYTLSLTEGVTSGDSLGNAAAFVVGKTETINLSAFVDLILGSGTRFKNLFDTVTLASSVTTVYQAYRILTDEIATNDSVAFQHNAFRNLTELVRLQDWISLKRFGSNWGD